MTVPFTLILFNYVFRRLSLLLVVVLLGVVAAPARALPAPPQSRAIDSLRHLLSLPQTDYNRVILLCQVSDQLWTQRTDSAAVYAIEALRLARRTNYQHGEGEALNRLGAALRESNLARALELFQQSLRIARATRRWSRSCSPIARARLNAACPRRPAVGKLLRYLGQVSCVAACFYLCLLGVAFAPDRRGKGVLRTCTFAAASFR